MNFHQCPGVGNRKRSGFVTVCLALGLSIHGGLPAVAQKPSDLSNIDRRLEQRELAKPPAVPAPMRILTAPPAESFVRETRPFVLSGVVVEGSTVFEPADFTVTYDEFLARKVTLKDIETILGRITQMYRDAGYFLSRAIAPKQSITAGLLQVRIIEGYVAHVSGADAYRGRKAVDQYAGAILDEKPLRLATIERALLLINDLPGLSLDPLLKPIDERGDRYELLLGATYRPVELSAQFDNRGTPEVGRLQGFVSGALNAPFGYGERIEASFVTVPNQAHELLYGALSANLPVGARGVRFSLFTAFGAVDAGGSKADLDSNSRSEQVIARLWYPVIRTTNQSLWITGTFDFRNFRETQFDLTVTRDRLRVLRAGAVYATRDRFKGESWYRLELSQGMDMFLASESGSSKLSRPDGGGEFTKITGDITRHQKVSDRLDLQLRLLGQWSADPLLSYEEFSVGGERVGRAYDFAEIAGEHGVAASAELRFTPSMAWDWLQSYQVYGFYDIGAVWNDVSGGANKHNTLSSLGFGLRFAPVENVRAEFEAAKPLTGEVETRGNDDWNVFFNLSLSY